MHPSFFILPLLLSNFDISKVDRIFAPVIKEKIGKDLSLRIDWNSKQSNAYVGATGSEVFIVVEGGLLGEGRLNQDGLSLVLCHELGHFLGGAPAVQGRSVEGQADYFATLECLPKVFEDEDNFVLDVPENIRGMCGGSEICERSILASWNVMEVLTKGKVSLSVEERSPERVQETWMKYPSPQCRLDTMIAGARGEKRPPCWFKQE